MVDLRKFTNFESKQSLKLKLRISTAILGIYPIMLYYCETWKLTIDLYDKLEAHLEVESNK